MLDTPGPIRALLPRPRRIYLVRESPCPRAAHLSNATSWQRWRLSPILQGGNRDPEKLITLFCQELKGSPSQIRWQTLSPTSSPQLLHSFHVPQWAPIQDRANAIVNPNPFPVKGKKDFPVHDINISCLLVFLPRCYQSGKQQQRRRSMPYSLPSSNEGERGDREIPNTLVFIKIRELN